MYKELTDVSLYCISIYHTSYWPSVLIRPHFKLVFYHYHYNYNTIISCYDMYAWIYWYTCRATILQYNHCLIKSRLFFHILATCTYLVQFVFVSRCCEYSRSVCNAGTLIVFTRNGFVVSSKDLKNLKVLLLRCKKSLPTILLSFPKFGFQSEMVTWLFFFFFLLYSHDCCTIVDRKS